MMVNSRDTFNEMVKDEPEINLNKKCKESTKSETEGISKCINCGKTEFKKAVIEICKCCGNTYSDEEATLIIADAIDRCNQDTNCVTDIKTARRCMNGLLLKCNNKFCLNESCPLNKVYDSIQENQEQDKLCKCGHHANDHSYPYPETGSMALECDICDCNDFTIQNKYEVKGFVNGMVVTGKKKGCGVLVCYENGRNIHCGEIMWGKILHCCVCSKLKDAAQDEGVTEMKG